MNRATFDPGDRRICKITSENCRESNRPIICEEISGHTIYCNKDTGYLVFDSCGSFVPAAGTEFALEKGDVLILAASPHDLDGTGCPAGIGKAAGTMLLQYHFNTGSKFRPYIGAGLNDTITYAENTGRSLEAFFGPASVSADNC